MSEGMSGDSGTPTLEVRDVLAPDEPLIEDDEDLPIADAPLPGYGTE